MPMTPSDTIKRWENEYKMKSYISGKDKRPIRPGWEVYMPVDSSGESGGTPFGFRRAIENLMRDYGKRRLEMGLMTPALGRMSLDAGGWDDYENNRAARDEAIKRNAERHKLVEKAKRAEEKAKMMTRREALKKMSIEKQNQQKMLWAAQDEYEKAMKEKQSWLERQQDAKTRRNGGDYYGIY